MIVSGSHITAARFFIFFDVKYTIVIKIYKILIEFALEWNIIIFAILQRGDNNKNTLNYGNLSPQNHIYQSFCGDFFSIILMVFIIKE